MTTIVESARKTRIVPPETPQFASQQPPTIRLYPVSNYTFSTKEPQPEEDSSVQGRMRRLQEQYETSGMRRSCEAVLVCHEHGHPYILMLQIANSFYKLPGDYLAADQSDEVEAFKTQLTTRFGPEEGAEGSEDENNYQWNISECLSQWWRPNFEQFMYPFIPPHVTRPKECKKMYMVQLPEKKVLAIPKNMKMLAVPLFELYDNAARYGNQLASIPLYLARYNFEYIDSDGNVISRRPASAPVEL